MKSKKKKKKVKKTRYDNLGPILMMFLGTISFISLISSKMGLLGEALKKSLFFAAGFGAYILPILLIYIGIKKFKGKSEFKSIVYLLVLFICFLLFVDISNNKVMDSFRERVLKSLEYSKDGLGAGLIGSSLAYLSLKLFGSIGSYILIFTTTLIGALHLTEIDLKSGLIAFKDKLVTYIKKLKESSSNLGSKLLSEKPKKEKVKKEKKATRNDLEVIDYKSEDPKKEDRLEDIIISDYSEREVKKNLREKPEESRKPEDQEKAEYIFPDLDLLKDREKEYKKDMESSMVKASSINETMDNFGIDAQVKKINRGPSITCYELEPAPGVKVSKILSLTDDLALALATSDIRIEAPIPGKAAIGIEVPNDIQEAVYLKELLQNKDYGDYEGDLPLVLGKDISGKPLISSIDKMPHLLIAGATGSGKSVCINSIIISILYKAKPKDVRLLLIDPKVVELSVYNGIPHLLLPVVSKAKDATFALKWAVDEMEKRYEVFAEKGVRDIKSFNKWALDNNEETMEKIVIIIDELADLMMVAAQEIEDYICRLAQMARAAGMHLIVATQRPSVDVITGTIKANIPSRISFSVSSQIDSRTILDMAGAEKLLGRGDMLFYPSSYSKPKRIQGAFIDDDEVYDVVEFLKSQNKSSYNKEVLEEIEEKRSMETDESKDELYNPALRLVVEENQASISFLQRKLSIGYNRAARIIDQLEAAGIVGGHEGNKARNILISPSDIENYLN